MIHRIFSQGLVCCQPQGFKSGGPLALVCVMFGFLSQKISVEPCGHHVDVFGRALLLYFWDPGWGSMSICICL